MGNGFRASKGKVEVGATERQTLPIKISLKDVRISQSHTKLTSPLNKEIRIVKGEERRREDRPLAASANCQAFQKESGRERIEQEKIERKRR